MEVEDYIILVLFFIVIIQLNMKHGNGKCGSRKGGFRM